MYQQNMYMTNKHMKSDSHISLCIYVLEEYRQISDRSHETQP